MILATLLDMITQLGNELSSILPIIEELPWGMDAVITNAVGGLKYLSIYLPFLNTVLTAFIIYLAFRIVLKVLRAVPFLGRTLD